MSGRYAIATVSSDDFALGSAVALSSFREANRWFAGDAVVIARELGAEERALIAASGPVIVHAPSPELVRRIDALADARPVLAPKRLRFCSLETFALEGYDKVLFLDSDVVVTGDFQPLFERPEPFLAAPDTTTLREGRRDRESFAPVAADHPDAVPSFNAGMMVLGGELLGGRLTTELLDLLHPRAWEGVESDHTDQFVLNRRLAREAVLVDPAYNLPVGHRASGEAVRERRLSEIRMFHFNGPRKPWKPARIVGRAMEDPLVRHGWAQWHRALDRMVAAAELSRISGQGG